MTRACVLLLFLTGCTENLPDEPVVIDLSNDVIIVEATCVTGCPDEDGEPDTSAGDVPDVQDRCPDLPDDDDGDNDGCPEPAPAG
jgi:hypothetical protein